MLNISRSLHYSGRYSHVIGHFFYSDEFEMVCELIEQDEELLWLSNDEAIAELYHPHHRWAVGYVWNNKYESWNNYEMGQY